MRRHALVTFIALALLGTACSDDGGVQVGGYTVASTPPITPTRTLIDSKGLRYLIDDDAGCVQVDIGDEVATGCMPFAPSTGVATDQGAWRLGNDVIGLFMYSAEGLTASSGGRVVARWFSPLHDSEPDEVDAIPLLPDVYVLAYRSPIDVPIWGVQLRAADGRLVQATPLVGQFLNAPR